MNDYSEEVFKGKVSSALTQVRTILENTRKPEYAANVPHEYVDKFLLANFLANTTLASFLNVLETLGMKPEALKKMKEWSEARSVTVRFKAEETCTFLREVSRQVESKTQYVTEWSGGGKRTDKVVRSHP